MSNTDNLMLKFKRSCVFIVKSIKSPNIKCLYTAHDDKDYCSLFSCADMHFKALAMHVRRWSEVT